MAVIKTVFHWFHWFYPSLQPGPTSSTKTTQKPVSKPVFKPVSKPIPSSSNQTYLQSIYGRQHYQGHRTTSKAPYLHYQSPVNPRTAALTAAILGPGHKSQSHETSQPIRVKSEKPRKDAWYYFHPSIDRSQVIPSGDGKVHVHAPLEGRKMPMAIPLGKPRTDPSLRVQLPSTSGIIAPGICLLLMLRGNIIHDCLPRTLASIHLINNSWCVTSVGEWVFVSIQN